MKIDHTLPGELGWQALHYVAHSLGESQRDAFELRLLDDQTAREAVAQAVELAHSVAVLHMGSNFGSDLPVVVPESAANAIASPNSSVTVAGLDNLPTNALRTGALWNSRLAAFGVGIAACLAVVLAWQNSTNVMGRGDSRDSSVAQSHHNGDQRLAIEPSREHLSLAWANMTPPGTRSNASNDSISATSLSDEIRNSQAAAPFDDDGNTGIDEHVVLEWIVTGLQDSDSPGTAAPTTGAAEPGPVNQGKLPLREM